MAFVDEHIHQVSKNDIIGNHARETNLLSIKVNPETERMLDRGLDFFDRTPGGPVDVFEKVLDERDVQLAFIGRNGNHFNFQWRKERVCLGSHHFQMKPSAG